MGGGYQGEGSKTVIPAEAFAKITCRLVPNQNSEDIAQKVKKAILDACPSAVRCEVEVKGGGDPYVVVPPEKPGASGKETDLMKKGFSVAERCIEDGFGTKPIYLREGGSIPIIRDLKEVAGLESLMIGLFTNEDNLQPKKLYRESWTKNQYIREILPELALVGGRSEDNFGEVPFLLRMSSSTLPGLGTVCIQIAVHRRNLRLAATQFDQVISVVARRSPRDLLYSGYPSNRNNLR